MDTGKEKIGLKPVRRCCQAGQQVGEQELTAIIYFYSEMLQSYSSSKTMWKFRYFAIRGKLL